MTLSALVRNVAQPGDSEPPPPDYPGPPGLTPSAWCRKELGHAILHEPGEDRPNGSALLELEAESVAYVVCQHLGIETSDYSFGYVATWAGGGTEAREAIKAHGTRVQRAADQILTAVEAVQGLAREAVA